MKYLGGRFSVSMGGDDQKKWDENWERTFGAKEVKPVCHICNGSGTIKHTTVDGRVIEFVDCHCEQGNET